MREVGAHAHRSAHLGACCCPTTLSFVHQLSYKVAEHFVLFNKCFIKNLRNQQTNLTKYNLTVITSILKTAPVSSKGAFRHIPQQMDYKSLQRCSCSCSGLQVLLSLRIYRTKGCQTAQNNNGSNFPWAACRSPVHFSANPVYGIVCRIEKTNQMQFFRIRKPNESENATVSTNSHLNFILVHGLIL